MTKMFRGSRILDEIHSTFFRNHAVVLGVSSMPPRHGVIKVSGKSSVWGDRYLLISGYDQAKQVVQIRMDAFGPLPVSVGSIIVAQSCYAICPTPFSTLCTLGAAVGLPLGRPCFFTFCYKRNTRSLNDAKRTLAEVCREATRPIQVKHNVQSFKPFCMELV